MAEKVLNIVDANLVGQINLIRGRMSTTAMAATLIEEALAARGLAETGPNERSSRGPSRRTARIVRKSG